MIILSVHACDSHTNLFNDVYMCTWISVEPPSCPSVQTLDLGKGYQQTFLPDSFIPVTGISVSEFCHFITFSVTLTVAMGSQGHRGKYFWLTLI